MIFGFGRAIAAPYQLTTANGLADVLGDATAETVIGPALWFSTTKSKRDPQPVSMTRAPSVAVVATCFSSLVTWPKDSLNRTSNGAAPALSTVMQKAQSFAYSQREPAKETMVSTAPAATDREPAAVPKLMVKP
jgi:hypothetical protein